MKKLLLSMVLTIITATSFGQWHWGIDFDSPINLDRIVRDTVSNPNCSWQIGSPNKTVFTTAYSAPNAIVTDTVNSVPPNDTSIFYLKHVRDQAQPFHVFMLQFWFQMNGDSTDFGTIEISPDTGKTWINVLTEDTTYNMYWLSPKPTLKGSTTGWQEFYLNLVVWASDNFGNYPIAMTADTILFRFTYITDSSSSPYDGWMIDHFDVADFFSGIKEIRNDHLISIAPNPATDKLIIHRMKHSDHSTVQILNLTGQVLFEKTNFKGEPIDLQHLSSGIYLLRYADRKYFSVKRFVVQH